MAEDESLDAMSRRFQEMEQEAQKLKDMHAEVEDKSREPIVDAKEVDARSIYIGNVDYTATPEDLQAHFQSCGTINRVTVLCDKHTGHPKGFAYVEFADPASVQNSSILNESLFKGRALAVSAKRTNVPFFQRGRGRGRGFSRGRGRPRGRGFRGRGVFTPY